jgi:hypothetical protein
MNTRLIARSIVALVTVICLGPRVAHAQQPTSEAAQAPRPITFGFALGGEASIGAFAHDPTNRAPAFDLVIQVPLSPRRLTVRADVMSHGFQSSGSVVLVSSPAAPGSGASLLDRGVLSWSADVVARLNDPARRWSPYALAGAALYTRSGRDAALPPTGAGLQAGAGFEVRTGRRTVLFAEYRYMAMGTGGVAPITLGMRF